MDEDNTQTYWVLVDPKNQLYPYYYTYHYYNDDEEGTVACLMFVELPSETGGFLTKELALEEQEYITTQMMLAEEDYEVAKRLVPQHIKEVVRIDFEVLE